MCKCPLTGNTHFYKCISPFRFLLKNCVNALVRATLISTDTTVDSKEAIRMCKCPRTGNTHFYRLKRAFRTLGNSGVNALVRATLISTILSIVGIIQG